MPNARSFCARALVFPAEPNAPRMLMDAPLLAVALDASSLAAGGLLLAGIAAVAFPMYSKFFRAKPGDSAQRPSVSDRSAEAAALARERKALQALINEAREATRLASLEIDARLERLERLIEHADAAADQLEPAGHRGHHSFAELKPAARFRDESRAHDRARRRDIEPGPDPLALRAMELADQGRSPLEIAQQLGEHPGKIELVLALNRR